MGVTAVGRKIRKIRLSKGFGLREISRKCLISATYLLDIEKGRRLPPSYMIDVLGAALGVHPEIIHRLNPNLDLQAIEDLIRENPLWVDVLRKIIDKKIDPETLINIL